MLELSYKNKHKHGLVQFKMPLKSRTKTNDEKKKTVQTTASAKGMYKVANIDKGSGRILINAHLHLQLLVNSKQPFTHRSLHSSKGP